jgi:hypothetical protein
MLLYKRLLLKRGKSYFIPHFVEVSVANRNKIRTGYQMNRPFGQVGVDTESNRSLSIIKQQYSCWGWVRNGF